MRVRKGMYAKHPTEARVLQAVALRLAAVRGAAGFTAGDVLYEAGGRDRFPRNLIGAVLGSLRAHHAICVTGRRKGESPKGKGRWVNVFQLNGDALEVRG